MPAAEGHSPRLGRYISKAYGEEILSIPATARSIGVSAPTVAKSVEHMQHLGMLREITGRQRHRLFVYDAYLAILRRGKLC